jgi:ureidoglycolate dehydrogenase (NAD+)
MQCEYWGRIRSAVCELLSSRVLAFGHAVDVADALVETSLLGMDTRGVGLPSTYLKELKSGRANRSPLFEVRGRYAAAGVFYADNALGVVAANAATREAIKRAKETGIAALAVADSNHFGAAGYYARMGACEI